MTGSPSRHSTIAVFAGTGLAVVLIVLVFGWTGALKTSSCASSGGPTESVNGRTYCYVTVPIPVIPPSVFSNYTEWGYAFQIHNVVSFGMSDWVNATITEPDGSSSTGLVYYIGFADLPRAWFTPDCSAGVMYSENTTPVEGVGISLLVET